MFVEFGLGVTGRLTAPSFGWRLIEVGAGTRRTWRRRAARRNQTFPAKAQRSKEAKRIASIVWLRLCSFAPLRETFLQNCMVGVFAPLRLCGKRSYKNKNLRTCYAEGAEILALY